MTTFLTASPPETFQWLSPAPLWDDALAGPAGSGLTQPWIAEMKTDSFIDDFLAMMAGTEGGQPSDLAGTGPTITADGTATGPVKLFQPLSQRYYLVVASLVCRRPGIPDHAVLPRRKEKATFVMRKLDSGGSESGLVAGQWVAASGSALLPGERQYPLHPAPVAAFAGPASTPGVLGMAIGAPSTRTVLYGYIPAGQRERMTPPIADDAVAAALAAVQKSMPLPNPPENPQVDELIGRVVQPWQRLRSAPHPSNANWPYYPSLYLILDLADWLRTYLNDLYAAILNGTTLPAGAGESLRAALAGITVTTSNPAGSVALTQAIKDLDGFAPLVRGVDEQGPTVHYNLSAGALPANWFGAASAAGSLAALALAALTAAKVPVQVPSELLGLIKNDPVLPAGVTSKDQIVYVIRTVFEHDPCRPVLSEPSRPFVLAPPMDAQAPARKIRIQLPDINQLRAFNRGVALEMPPSLRRLLDRVTPEMMKGDPLGDDPGLQLGMICSFSLQIIFLVAFIVMFMFLILLNIVFWWLPFLKICFPMPVPPTQPQGPAPGQQP
jgi:hypothetical protein